MKKGMALAPLLCVLFVAAASLVSADCTCVGCTAYSVGWASSTTWTPSAACPSGQYPVLKDLQVQATDGDPFTVYTYNSAANSVFYTGATTTTDVICFNKASGDVGASTSSYISVVVQCHSALWNGGCDIQQSITFGCASTDTCPTSSTCSACTNRAGCGWCSSTGTCRGGISTGPSTGTCASGSWAWFSSSCPSTSLCANVNCGSHGTCSQTTGLCVCSDSYTGSSCSTAPVVPGQCPTDQICSDNGQCIIPGRYTTSGSCDCIANDGSFISQSGIQDCNACTTRCTSTLGSSCSLISSYQSSYASGSTCSPTPVSGVWSAWSTCSATCDSGTQTRTCSIPTPANGVPACDGVTQQNCNIESCSITPSLPVQPTGTSCSCSCCLGNSCASALVGYAPVNSCSGADCSSQCRATFASCPAATASGFLLASCTSKSSSSDSNAANSASSSSGSAIDTKAFDSVPASGVLNGWSSSSTCAGSAVAALPFTVGICVNVPASIGSGSFKFSSCSTTDGWTAIGFAGSSCTGQSDTSIGTSGQCSSETDGMIKSRRVDCNTATALTWSISSLIAVALGTAAMWSL